MTITPLGNRELSAWLVVPGVCWIQAKSPEYARKLSVRGDSRLVVRGVAGGYLRTFEFLRGLAWARSLIARYQSGEKVANGAIPSRKSPPARRNVSRVSLG